ncbi:MAG TPA: FkbM family methyltransferase [bacterium]|jgi:FkbM family methyltransferase|nr:FkbM family methyltransferase [bacterium]
MGVKHGLRKLFWKMGLDITRFIPNANPIARRRQIFESYGIDLVLDIGANVGQFALQLRNDMGYSKRIVSFEPLSSAFQSLKQSAKKDKDWQVFNYALGDSDGKATINISNNIQSSSVLEMLPAHLQAAPYSHYLGREEIEIHKLDSLFDRLSLGKGHIYMKMDTQGFESKVLKGAKKSLSKIGTIQMEMSLVPLYKNELVFSDLYPLMLAKGYSLISLEAGFTNNENGQLLQVDGIFHRL